MRNRSLLYLRFNGHFPSGPGFAGHRNVCVLDFIAAKGRVLEVVSNNNWSYKMCKAPVKMSPSTNQHPVFTGRMPFLSPNQQCQSTEGKVLSIHSVFQNWWFGGQEGHPAFKKPSIHILAVEILQALHGLRVPGGNIAISISCCCQHNPELIHMPVPAYPCCPGNWPLNEYRHLLHCALAAAQCIVIGPVCLCVSVCVGLTRR